MAKAKLSKEEKAALKMQERIEAQRASRLAELRAFKEYGPPTIIRKVGDRVQHGAIKHSVIKEVLDDGRIYFLDQIVTDNNYGNPIDSAREYYVSWYEVETYYSPEQREQLPRFEDSQNVRLNFSQTQLYSVIRKFYIHGGCDFDPVYQRGFVWELSDKVALIDSIFNNVDIGKFVFIRLPYTRNGPTWEVLDGKQRLLALVEFYEGRFEYKGYKYYDMHPLDRDHFEGYPASYADVQNITLEQKIQYFLKLNTGGRPQDPKHMEEVAGLLKTFNGTKTV